MKVKRKPVHLSQHEQAVTAAKKILGHNVLDHELLSEKSQDIILQCTSLKQIVRVFEDRHLEVHGSEKFLGWWSRGKTNRPKWSKKRR